MCELLVHKTDKVPPSHEHYHTFHAAGDVIVVCPDGWVFGKAEREHPDFLILHVPDMTEAEASVFLAPLRVTHGLPRQRAFALDLAHPAVVGKPTISKADAEVAKFPRVALPDPKVIGPDPGVIG